MDEDRIALNFITVYKSFKDRSFLRRKKRMEDRKELLGKEETDRRSRLDKIKR